MSSRSLRAASTPIDLAHGEVGGAGPRRGEEEDHAPGGGLRGGGPDVGPEQERRDDQQEPREDVGAGDHRLAPDGVEQPPEDQRPEEVADRERDDVVADARGLDVIERAEHERIGEEDGVVEERLADEERQADDRAPGVGAEHGLRDREQAHTLLLAHLDRLSGLLELRNAGGLLDLALDVVHERVGLVGLAVDEHPARALRDVKKRQTARTGRTPRTPSPPWPRGRRLA
jgi:hypothetical protein